MKKSTNLIFGALLLLNCATNANPIEEIEVHNTYEDIFNRFFIIEFEDLFKNNINLWVTESIAELAHKYLDISGTTSDVTIGETKGVSEINANTVNTKNLTSNIINANSITINKKNIDDIFVRNGEDIPSSINANEANTASRSKNAIIAKNSIKLGGLTSDNYVLKSDKIKISDIIGHVKVGSPLKKLSSTGLDGPSFSGKLITIVAKDGGTAYVKTIMTDKGSDCNPWTGRCDIITNYPQEFKIGGKYNLVQVTYNAFVSTSNSSELGIDPAPYIKYNKMVPAPANVRVFGLIHE